MRLGREHLALTHGLLALTLLWGCKPPASDDYLQRTEPQPERDAPSAPIGSPDTQGALWAPGTQPMRLIYGQPGKHPLLSLECDAGTLIYTRYVRADAHAKAVLALIGNGHVERLWIDAHENGDAWLWRGTISSADPRLEVLTGPNAIEATVPGAGSVTLNPSRMPGELIRACRQDLVAVPAPPADPA